jgi:hypothetical protein
VRPVGGGARSAAVRRIAPAIFGNRFRCRHQESMWRLALRGSGMGSVAGGFAAAKVVRCHRIIHRRGDARGAPSVSGGSAADLGSALIR